MTWLLRVLASARCPLWHHRRGLVSFVTRVTPMKFISAIIALFIHAAVAQAAEPFPTFTFETESHVIEITPRCPEGYVSCDKVGYKGIDRKTGATLALRGKTMHTTCADGVTPCRFLGYRFRNGKHIHHVWEDGDGAKGTLEVKAGRKVLLTERGTWK